MTYDPNNIDTLNRVEPPYLGAYGLTQAPFSMQQDDRFFYSNSALTERLELLKHYTQYGNLLLIISGERGIGKSSLKQHFINTAQEEWQICEIQSHTMMDASLLLKQVANGFGITEAPHDPSALFEVLSDQLEHIHQSSNVPILIIDDAHELPQDALQALLYLAEHHSEQHTTLRIILFCEPEIEVMLEDPAIHSLKERVTHSMEIPALDEIQTAEYLRHRLAVAGLDGTSPFTPKLINKIFKASDGVPAKINDYAHQNLLDDTEPTSPDELEFENELIHETSNLNLRNIVLGGVALVLVVTGLLFQDQINSLFEEPQPVIAKTTPPQIKIASPEKQTEPANTSNIDATPKVPPVEEKTIEFSLDKTPKTDKKPADNTKKDSAEIKLISVNPNPVPGSKQRQIISISGKGFNKNQKVNVSWTGKEKTLKQTQVTFTSDTYINLILNVGMQADTWKVTLVDPALNIKSNTISFDVVSSEKEKNSAPDKSTLQVKPTPRVKSTPQVKTDTKVTKPAIKVEPVKTVAAKKQNDGLLDQRWIRQQNKNHFTLQLLGTHQQSTLPTYLKKHSLKNDAASFRTKRNAKDWFTLIYGSYPTRTAAQAAAKQLPRGVSKPWIRSFTSILPSLSKIQPAKTTSTMIPTAKIPDNQEGWLWSQDPSHYTLQLAAGTDKKAIQAFIKRHNLTGKAIFFHRLRDGKDWYILVHGSYSGYSNAKKAISQLPQAVQKAKPWARSFGAIHAELN